MKRQRSVLLAAAMACLLAAGAALAAASSSSKPKTPPRLAPDELREVNKLLGDFRAARGDLEARGEICKNVLAVGPGAVPLISAAIERELRPQLKRYSGKFQAQAAQYVKKRVADIDLDEVAQLRKTVLGIQKRGDGFTKEAIVRDGDPAMRRLEQMCIIDRKMVLEQSEALGADRERLIGLGKLWQRCQSQLPKPPAQEGEEPAKLPNFAEYLRGEESLAAALAAPMDQQTRGILAVNARLAEKLDPEEARAILACNLTRNLLGLSALAIDCNLCDAARDHSKDMETLHFFAHESPVPGKKTPWDRAKNFGTSASAENIFRGCHDGRAANQGWFHSPGHHANMLGNHARIGVGRSGLYYTEAFGK
jgi:uncharacterized protein YkwD